MVLPRTLPCSVLVMTTSSYCLPCVILRGRFFGLPRAIRDRASREHREGASRDAVCNLRLTRRLRNNGDGGPELRPACPQILPPQRSSCIVPRPTLRSAT